MTKKNYIAIADVIAKSFSPCYGSARIDNSGQEIIHPFEKRLLDGLADYFRLDNPRFDRQRFRNACLVVAKK